METITLQLNDKQLKMLAHLYSEYKIDKQLPYVEAQYRMDDCVVTAYTSKKVVFQGKGAADHAMVFQVTPTFETQAGSDEVGTGDYFGPVCVCACILQESDYQKLPVDLLKDSKKMKDSDIREVAPKLMKILPHSLLILSNRKYNEVHHRFNMNQIKALLHNQAYINLKKKVGQLPNKIIVDQFTPEKSYYRYLSFEETVIRNIHFETKAEDKYLVVACASIIARYAFLKALDDMDKHYNWQFPKGAGIGVDQRIAAFVKQFGEDELKNVAKLHFKNTEKYKEFL